MARAVDQPAFALVSYQGMALAVPKLLPVFFEK